MIAHPSHWKTPSIWKNRSTIKNNRKDKEAMETKSETTPKWLKSSAVLMKVLLNWKYLEMKLGRYFAKLSVQIFCVKIFLKNDTITQKLWKFASLKDWLKGRYVSMNSGYSCNKLNKIILLNKSHLNA